MRFLADARRPPLKPLDAIYICTRKSTAEATLGAELERASMCDRSQYDSRNIYDAGCPSRTIWSCFLSAPPLRPLTTSAALSAFTSIRGTAEQQQSVRR